MEDLPEYIAKSTEASGVPLKVADSQVLLDIGRLMTHELPKPQDVLKPDAA